MMPVCPKCGGKVIYIASRTMSEDTIYMVDAEEKQYITKTGRVSIGYKEHKCQIKEQ